MSLGSWVAQTVGEERGIGDSRRARTFGAINGRRQLIADVARRSQVGKDGCELLVFPRCCRQQHAVLLQHQRGERIQRAT